MNGIFKQVIHNHDAYAFMKYHAESLWNPMISVNQGLNQYWKEAIISIDWDMRLNKGSVYIH